MAFDLSKARRPLKRRSSLLKRIYEYEDDEDESIVVPTEPALLTWLRVIIIIGVCLLAALLGNYAFTMLRASEFEADYSDLFDRISTQLRRSVDSSVDCAEDFALNTPMPPGGFAYYRNFMASATRKLRVCQLRNVQIFAFVPAELQRLFEGWVALNADAIAAAQTDIPALRAYAAGRLRQGILDWKYKFFPNGTFEKLDTSPADPAYLPSFPGVPKIFMVGLQNAPMEFANVGALMLNGLNNSGRLEIFGESSMTRRTASTGIDLIPSDVFTGSVRPVISIGTGISFFNATSQQSVPAGSIGATIALDQALDMPGVSDAASLQIVFRCPFRNVNLQTYGLPNADSSRFTMFFQNQALQNQGFGDLTTTDRLDQYVRTVPIKVPSMNCSMTVYPTKSYYNRYLSNDPGNSVIAGVLLTAGMGAIFLAFDYFSRSHLASVNRAAAIATAQHATDREKIRGKHAFVAMVSHEIRTPASAIVGALDIIMSTKLTSFQQELLGIIRGGGAQILGLVEDALRGGEDGDSSFVVRPRRSDPRRDILENSWNTVRLQKRFQDKVRKISMHMEVQGPLPQSAIVDADRASQIITNLLGNSVKFVEEGTGSVTMTASFDRTSGLLRVVVKDNGRGMTPEGLAKIFKPFSQAEGQKTSAVYGGTGLGLVVSRDIANAMGGDLTCSSPGLGLGAEFVATWLLADPVWKGTSTSKDDATRGSGLLNLVGSHSSGNGNENGYTNGHASGGHSAARAGSDYGTSAGGGGFIGSLLGVGRRAGSVDGGNRRGSDNQTQAKAAPEPFANPADFGGDAPLPANDGKGAPAAPAARMSATSSGGGFQFIFGARQQDASGGTRRSVDGPASPRPFFGERLARLSATGNGTVVPEQQAQPHILSNGGAAAGKGRKRPLLRALCAEDDDLCSRVLRMTLKMVGVDAAVVADGEAASAELEKDLTAYDIILLDGHMGGGDKDGLPTLVRMRELFAARGVPAPPIVLLTGDSGAEEHAAIMDAGATRVVVKPATQVALRGLSALAEKFRESSQRGAGGRLRPPSGSDAGDFSWGEPAAAKANGALAAAPPPPSSPQQPAPATLDP